MALILNVKSPSFVGVPEITPVDLFMLKPVGRVPDLWLQVIVLLPVAASVTLYFVSVSPFGSS